MSDQPPRQIIPPPRPRRHIVISIIMVFFGIILLLPGACALFFASMGGPGNGSLAVLWLVCFAISAGGIALIVKAFR
jgi:hypothetical protein